jgi:serine/threonine protein kinase
MAQVIVAGKYQLLKKIGSGSFGKIFRGVTPPRPPADAMSDCINPNTSAFPDGGSGGSTPLAVKIMSIEHSALHKNEVAIYEKLREINYIPSLYASGTEGKFTYLVMDLLEQSVEELHKNYGDQMSLKVVIHLGLQMLNITEQIHACGIVHRDLKPANFLLKTNAQNISELYLIDFGLAKCFLDEKNRHGAIKTNEQIVGTTRYMSVNVHQGLTASRRDDLEALGYSLLFLYQGKLPWQNQSSVASVVDLKQQFGWFNHTLGEFVLFILYCRNLGFSDKPNYDYLRGILTNLNKLYECQ